MYVCVCEEIIHQSETHVWVLQQQYTSHPSVVLKFSKVIEWLTPGIRSKLVAVIQWLIWRWWAMISDPDSPCILAVTIPPSFSLSFLVCNLSLSATLSQQEAFPTIYSPSGLLYLQLASMRERARERGANGASLLSQPGRGMMWERVKTKDEHEKGGWCHGLLQLCRYERLNGKSPPDAAGAAHRASSWLVRRTTGFQSFTLGLSRTGALIHAHTLSRYPPPVKFCHRTSTVISFGPCGFGISVTQELQFTPVICFKADLLDWGNPYVNSALFTRCVQAFSFEITSVKRPGCFWQCRQNSERPFIIFPNPLLLLFSSVMPVSAAAPAAVGD